MAFKKEQDMNHSISEQQVENNKLINQDKIDKLIQKHSPNSVGLCYNPATKQSYPYKNNSYESRRLFKAFNCHGTNGRKETLVWYFDSPEEYENYRRRTNKRFKVKKQIKDNFYKRMNKLIIE